MKIMKEQFKDWVQDALDTAPEREQEFIDEEVNKEMNSIMNLYRKITLTEETEEVNEDNFNEPAFKIACNKHMYNFDKAKDWLFNNKRN